MSTSILLIFFFYLLVLLVSTTSSETKALEKQQKIQGATAKEASSNHQTRPTPTLCQALDCPERGPQLDYAVRPRAEVEGPNRAGRPRDHIAQHSPSLVGEAFALEGEVGMMKRL